MARYQISQSIATVTTTTTIVSVIFHAAEKRLLRQSMGSANGPSSKNRDASTKAGLSDHPG